MEKTRAEMMKIHGRNDRKKHYKEHTCLDCSVQLEPVVIYRVRCRKCLDKIKRKKVKGNQYKKERYRIIPSKDIPLRAYCWTCKAD